MRDFISTNSRVKKLIEECDIFLGGIDWTVDYL